MSRLNLKNVRSAVSGVVAHLPRPSMPTLTPKRAAIGGAAGMAAAVAVVLFAPRPQRGWVQVQNVTTGFVSDGAVYCLVSTRSGLTFVVPAFQYGAVYSYAANGTLMPYTLGLKRVEGYRLACVGN